MHVNVPRPPRPAAPRFAPTSVWQRTPTDSRFLFRLARARHRQRLQMTATITALAAGVAALVSASVVSYLTPGERPTHRPAAPPAAGDWSALAGVMPATNAITVSQDDLWLDDWRDGMLLGENLRTGRWQWIEADTYGICWPSAIAAVGPDLWVTGLCSLGPGHLGSVSEINIRTGRLVRTLVARRYGFCWPDGIAATGAELWVTSLCSGSLTEINARTGRVIRIVQGSRYGLYRPAAIAVYGSYIWVVNAPSRLAARPRCCRFDRTDGRYGNGSVVEFDVRTGRLMRILTNADGIDQPAAIGIQGSYVVIANRTGRFPFRDGLLTVLDARDGNLASTLPTGRSLRHPDGIASDGNEVWVAHAVPGRCRVYTRLTINPVMSPVIRLTPVNAGANPPIVLPIPRERPSYRVAYPETVDKSLPDCEWR